MEELPTNFYCKEDCMERCRAFYEPLLQRTTTIGRSESKSKLIQRGVTYKLNDRMFTLLCSRCKRPVVEAFISRELGSQWIVKSFNLPTIHGSDEEGWCEPGVTSGRKKSIVQLSQTEVMGIVANDMCKGRKRGISTSGKIALLAAGGEGNVSASSVKAAFRLAKGVGLTHVESYQFLKPYFQLMQEQNPSLAYDINPQNGGTFQRLTVVLPYCEQFIPHLLNVYGLDAGHMNAVDLKGVTQAQLENALGDKEARPVFKDFLYNLPALTLTIFTGLTLEHTRILLGYCISHGENHDDTRFFLNFLLSHGGQALNCAKNIIMSDRGACAGPVDEVFPLTIHHYCPLHLSRNLSKFPEECKKYFWRARKARTKLKYDFVMSQLKGFCEEAYDYLSGISNWQLYIIVESCAVLHEIKSDNLVEGMFSTLLHARGECSPLYVAHAIHETVLKGIGTALQNTGDTGLLVKRALKASTANYIESVHYTATLLSRNDFEVRKTGQVKRDAEVFQVNTSRKTCSCQHWQQSGSPCYHAWAALVPIGERDAMEHKPEYYYPFVLLRKLKGMWQSYTPMIRVSIPDAKILHAVDTFPHLAPKTAHVPKDGVPKPKKRMASTGDRPGGGGVTAHGLKRMKKVRCEYCNAFIASSTSVHTLSQCCVHNAHANKSGSLHTTANAIHAYNASLTLECPVYEDPTMEEAMELINEL